MISSIILAAGKSTRMGACKQLMKIGKRTMLQRVIRNIMRSDVDGVVVVLGFRADELYRSIPAAKKIKVVVNEDFNSGLSSSLKAGLEALDEDVDAAIFVLADQPFVDASVINSLTRTYKKTKAPIVIPTYKGKRGNPVLIDKSLFEEVKSIFGDVGARQVVWRHAKEAREVEVDNPGILFDVDTPEEFESARKTLGISRESKKPPSKVAAP